MSVRRFTVQSIMAVAVLAAMTAQPASAKLITLAEITVAANERFNIRCDRAVKRGPIKARRTFFRARCANGVYLRVYTKKSRIDRIVIETEKR